MAAWIAGLTLGSPHMASAFVPTHDISAAAKSMKCKHLTYQMATEMPEQQSGQAAQPEPAVRPEYCSTALALGHAHHGPAHCDACCGVAGKLGKQMPHAKDIVIGVTLLPALSTLQLIRRLKQSSDHGRRLLIAADHSHPYPGDSHNWLRRSLRRVHRLAAPDQFLTERQGPSKACACAALEAHTFENNLRSGSAQQQRRCEDQALGERPHSG